MNKSRKIYGSIFLFSLFILLLSGSRYVLAAVAAEAALLLLLRILLSVDAKGIQLMQKMQTACVAGQELRKRNLGDILEEWVGQDGQRETI